MVLLESTDIEIGSKCPDFSLKSVDGKNYQLSNFSESKGLLVAFICNHCPYVQAIEDRLIALAKHFPKEQFQVVGICSNDPGNYPDDAPDQLYNRWKEKDYGFVYLVDHSQEVARSFGAVCTPDLFVYDQNRNLFYHGRLDDNWKEAAKVQKEELKEAVIALVEGQPSPSIQQPAMGCSIKWRN